MKLSVDAIKKRETSYVQKAIITSNSYYGRHNQRRFKGTRERENYKAIMMKAMMLQKY